MKTVETERYGAAEKCRAVLAVWTDRRKAAELCREMGISAALFSQWQERALSGILEALEPRDRQAAAEGPALPAHIRRLLDRKSRSRELETLGRSANWRARTVRGKEPRPITPPPANS